MFDNGRLKKATCLLAGFGLRAVKDDGWVCALLRRLVAGADPRRRPVAAVRSGYSGILRPPAHANVRLWRRNRSMPGL
jgi:hypothetical protein